MSFLPILIFFGVVFFISPGYYVYKISHGKMNSSDFPLLYLIMVLTLSLWWLVIGIKEDRIQGNHFVIGLLGTVFLNIWIVNYNLAARESKILLFIIFMILFIYEIFIFYISFIIVYNENNKFQFNIFNFIIIVLTFSSPLLSVFFTNRQKHKQIPLLCNLTGFSLNVVWILKEILENLPSLVNINLWEIISFGSGAFLTFFQLIMYNILKKRDLKKIKKKPKKDVEEELISKENEDDDDDDDDNEDKNKNKEKIEVEDKEKMNDKKK